ncbi:MAG TPA: hypothetical protein VFH62_02540 [Dehalococcoidia bacterium]|nr:hypothetical protein [Dehalococcoidia bacterium]
MTKEPVPTGIYATAQSFASLHVAAMQLLCPWCRTAHQWTKDMAYIEPEQAQGEP